MIYYTTCIRATPIIVIDRYKNPRMGKNILVQAEILQKLDKILK
jgi:hypothetical protein